MKYESGMLALPEADVRYVLDQIGVDPSGLVGTVAVAGTPLHLNSPIRVTESAAAALVAEAVAVASLFKARSGIDQDIEIDASQIAYALKPFVFTRLNGESSGSWTEHTTTAPCNGYFETADGRIVYMVNLIPKLRNDTLAFLKCAPDRSAVQAEISRWDAEELEAAAAAGGVPLAVMRSPDEWAAMPHGIALARSPLVTVELVGDAPRIPLSAAQQPFERIRVLDMTHVVAGPMITRGLAEYGADVLHVSPKREDLVDAEAIVREFGIGKRETKLGLDDAADLATLKALLAEADVFVHSWRPGALDRFGLTAREIAKLRPGIVQVSVNCYGPNGPWAARGGFDGLALSSVGVTMLEAEHDRPKLSPPGVLTDALAGFLGAGLVASLLMKRAAEGGSHAAQLSLARTAMWALDLGRVPVDPERPMHLGEPRMRQVRTTAGMVDHVAPVISFSHTESILPLRDHLSEANWLPASDLASTAAAAG